LGVYLQKLLLPVNLTFFYPLKASSTIDVRIIAVLLVFAIAVWKLRGKLAWSVLWIPLTLLPALAVSRVVVPLAERNLYLASVGFVWLLAAALSSLDRTKALLVAGALSAGYVTADWIRVPDWRDEISLFGQALRLDPDNASIRMKLSTEYGRRGRLDEAMGQLDEILTRDPNHLSALTNKAGLLVMKKDWQGVEETCARAFSVDRNSALCHLDLGIAELNRGRKREAWDHFDNAYRSNPRMWQALIQQATIASEDGDLPGAARKLESAAALSPTAQVFTSLGALYARMGDQPRAVGAFQTALRINPSFVAAQQGLAPFVQQPAQ
jgi:tetratricopeptide (TPR) repeat protein